MILRAITLLFLLVTATTRAQQVPSVSENIDFICTFSQEAELTWGDDDYTQIFFFIIPKSYKKAVYLRIFDPDCGGKNDQMNTLNPLWDSQTRFSVYGGPKTFSNEAAREYQLKGDFKSGNLLASETFSNESEYDNRWFSFGPFNPSEGEYVKEFDANVIKIVCEGISGNDGNLYRYFLSQRKEANVAVDGSNAFTYKYTFRLKTGTSETAHLYPLIDNNTSSIKQSNFDFDSEGIIKLFSVSKNGIILSASGDGLWATSEHKVTQLEKGKSMNLQIVKNQERLNDMSFYMLNQYDKAVPFFAIPIGGIPKYKFNVGINYNYINKSRSIGR